MVAGSQPAMPQETIRANGWISRRLASTNMPGKVDRIRAGLLRIAKDNGGDLLWTDASSLNRGATGDDTEFGSREIFERSAEFAEGSPCRRENNDFLF